MARLLQLSALSYFLPLIASWSVDHTYIMKIGMQLVIATSWLYHGGLREIKWLDMGLAHMLIVYHVCHAIAYSQSIWQGHVMLMFAAVLYAAWVYWYMGLSNKHDSWHASIHMITALGSSVYILGSGRS